jgi:drug/metabolite transporter (DMT)-like permease
VIWGASYLFIAEGLDALPPDGITFIRFCIGFVVLAFFPGARRPVPRSDFAGIFWLGLLWMALPMSMFPHAEQTISSALAGMMNAAIPLIATAVSAVLARRVPSAPVIASLAVGILGAVLIAAPGMNAGRNSASGVAMVSIALVCYGFAINLARPLQQRNGALPVVWRAIGVALVLTAPMGAPGLLVVRWSWGPALSILALGCLGTAAANVLMAKASGRLGAATASGTSFLIPVVALVLGVTIRGEHVPRIAIAGCALCLAAAWLIRREKIA